MADLTEQDQVLLAFERRRWRHLGVKEEAMKVELGLSVTGYWQRLNALIDEPAALVHDPVLVNRLRRLREQRRANFRRAG